MLPNFSPVELYDPLHLLFMIFAFFLLFPHPHKTRMHLVHFQTWARTKKTHKEETLFFLGGGYGAEKLKSHPCIFPTNFYAFLWHILYALTGKYKKSFLVEERNKNSEEKNLYKICLLIQKKLQKRVMGPRLPFSLFDI